VGKAGRICGLRVIAQTVAEGSLEERLALA
jgi:hypothetical protein